MSIVFYRIKVKPWGMGGGELNVNSFLYHLNFS